MADPVAQLTTQLQQLQGAFQNLEQQNTALNAQLVALQAVPPFNAQPHDLFAKPAKFKGERGPDAERFLTDIKRYIDRHAQNLPTINHQVELALTFMEDKAAKWKETMMEQIGQGNTPFADWQAFVDQFKLSFARIEDSAAAMEELKRIKQGNMSTAEYHDNFHRTIMRTPLSDIDRRARFYDGLSKAVKDALVFSQANTTSYPDLITEAIRLDNRITQRKWEESGKPRVYNNNWGYQNNRTPTMNTQPTYTAPDPNAMDISAGRSTDTRTCYNCGKQGHIRRFCKEPPQVKGRFVRATGSEGQTNQTPTSDSQGDLTRTIATTLVQAMERLAKIEAEIQKKNENQQGF